MRRVVAYRNWCGEGDDWGKELGGRKRKEKLAGMGVIFLIIRARNIKIWN